METISALLGKVRRKVQSSISGSYVFAALLAAALLGSATGCGDFWQAPNSGGTTADTVTLTDSAATVTAGGSITFTATISQTAATGTVTFYSGTNVLDSATVSSGVATLSPTFNTAGSFSITAKYSGDSTYESSTSNAVSITVTAALTATTTTLGAITPASPTASDQITFTATVAPAAATGTVTFLNGSQSLGTGTLSSGSASFVTTLAAGTYSITASYGGDTTYASSVSSPAVGLTVTAAAANVKYTTVTLAASDTSLQAGAGTTLKATVSNENATGNVQFYDTAVSPPLLLGIAPLHAGTATIPAAFKTAGTHQIMASYGGAANFGASVTQDALPITITQ